MRTRLLALIAAAGLVACATSIEAMEATATPRWSVSPVCPLVSGLSREEGEFILTRLSEIARGAGAPLAAEDCSPNLYILVTTDPKDLLREMEKRNRAFTFGSDASRGAVDAADSRASSSSSTGGNYAVRQRRLSLGQNRRKPTAASCASQLQAPVAPSTAPD